MLPQGDGARVLPTSWTVLPSQGEGQGKWRECFKSSCLFPTADQVRLIDSGAVDVVDVSQLLTLPDHLLARAPLVVEVVVCGIVPCDDDTDWPPPVSTGIS